MAGRKPKHMIDDKALRALRRFWKSRRSLCFSPRFARILRTKNGWPKMAGAGGHQQGSSIARIKHDVMDDMAQKQRRRYFPVVTCGIAFQQEPAFARRNEENDRAEVNARF